jgi:hypothetical protein
VYLCLLNDLPALYCEDLLACARTFTANKTRKYNLRDEVGDASLQEPSGEALTTVMTPGESVDVGAYTMLSDLASVDMPWNKSVASLDQAQMSDRGTIKYQCHNIQPHHSLCTD